MKLPIVTCIVFSVMFACQSRTLAGNTADLPEVRRFIDEMVVRNKMPREQLRRWFSQVRLRSEIIDAINRPAESLPWYRYKARFVDRGRVQKGIVFWRNHRKLLERAEREYGVPPEIIVAIIGIESRYGSFTGRYPVMDALTTLTLRYPRRSAFFRGELEHYLLLAREEGLDPLALKGSYAGAMGAPQFLASSYRHYAVDFDGDNKRDLLGNVADTIGSVANYFHEHGWRAGQVIASRARVNGSRHRSLEKMGIKPRLTVAEFRRNGVVPRARIGDSYKAALFRLEERRGESYRLGFNNFYVITRYNNSVHYGMAVLELSNEIRARYRGKF